MQKYLILIILLLFSTPCAWSYQVCFEGFTSQEIQEIIESVSELRAAQERPLPTLFTLKKRGESDKKTLIQVMHAFGFYEAKISIHYLGAFPDTTVRVEIEAGPQYYFGPSTVVNAEGLPLDLCFDDLALKAGCPARSDVILDTQEQVLEALGAQGYPLASLIKREIIVDSCLKAVFVSYSIEPGPLCYFGPICIEGLRSLRRKAVCRKILWQTGTLYNPRLVNCTSDYLLESGLFSYVMVTPADTLDENGTLPMHLQLEEKKFRHIGAGVSYSTDESAGALFEWSHDNLTGWGDAFAFVGEYSKVIKRATLLYAISDFFGRNQDLLYSAEVRREDAPGFIEREASFLIRLNRRINNCLTVNYGLRYERLLSTKSDNDNNYNLLSVPIQVRWDTSNRLLNPTKGTIVAYFSTPYKAIFNSHIFFWKNEIYATTYRSFTKAGSFLIALSGQLGSIVGEPSIIVPAPKRFYAGSSTSLRGYKYLTVSPLCGDKPIGGRSLLIFQVEPRVRIYGKLFFATFYDVGNVYSSSFPRVNEKMLSSWGVGLRYLTSLGPFRLDIGFPLDKRKGIDKSFQIYASIGQTF